MTKRNKISVIITTLNEAESIEDTLVALYNQTRTPGEIVLVDGGSSDETVKIATEVRKKLKGKKKRAKIKIRIIEKTGNRSVGRNEAVKKAKYAWVAITDAGCVPRKEWLEALCDKQTESKAGVVAGYYEGKPSTHLEEAIIPYVLVMPDVVNEATFLPATRSMLIKKALFKESGGFDESLSDNEDYAFAKKLEAQDEMIAFARWAIVYWSPPSTIRQFAKMIFRFARGDVYSGIVRPKVVLLFTRAIFFLLFTLYVVVGFFISRSSGWQQFWTGLWFVLVALYLSWSIDKNHRYAPKSWYWLPVLQITSDVMVLIGSLQGFWKLWNEKRTLSQSQKDR